VSFLVPELEGFMQLSTLAKGLGAVVCLGLLAAKADASIVVAQTDSSSGPVFLSWPVTPNTADAAGWSGGAFTGYGSQLLQFNSAETNYGSTPVPALAESFAATASGALSDIQLVIGGNPNGVTANLALYDAGLAPGTPTLQDTGSNTYTPGLSGVSTNLLSAASNAFTMPGYQVSGTTAAIFDFQFSGADAVNIVAGHQYVFEMNTPSNAGNLIWYRMANNTFDYPNGQAFRARGSLNGNPARDMSLAVTVSSVPEPASLGLVALGAVGLMARRRAKTA
jgi:hypothetical protein